MPVREVTYSNRYGLEMQSRNKVRRCLFGVPDRAELKKDLEEQLRSTQTDIKNTWNFDPVLDEPLDGRYEWRVVESTDYIPEFYRKGYESRKPKNARRRLSVSDDLSQKLSPPATPERVFPVIQSEADSDEEREIMRRENETTPEARIVPVQRQSRIEDFMKIRKRRLSDEEISESEEDRHRSRKEPKH